MNREKFSKPGYTRYAYEKIVFFTEEYAKKVLTRLKDIARIAGSVSVADFEEYCHSTYRYILYEDICYGWSEEIVNNAEVIVTEDLFYVINLPNPKVIEKLVY